MYKNRAANGRLNICGETIATMRMAMQEKTSQRALADRLQREGVDLDKNAIQRIESGKRFVTDVELKAFAAVFGTTADDLLNPSGK